MARKAQRRRVRIKGFRITSGRVILLIAIVYGLDKGWETYTQPSMLNWMLRGFEDATLGSSIIDGVLYFLVVLIALSIIRKIYRWVVSFA